jgi:CubicO group peptidase (beta-lactamase class C family)
MDSLIRNSQELELFSGIVLISEHDDFIYRAAVGQADRVNNIQNTLETKFFIAGGSKDLTAVIALQLYQEGLIELDDEILKYLDGFSDDRAKNVTIRQLLQHRSGFGNYLDHPNFSQEFSAYWTPNSIMNLVREERLLFEPGEREAYSNSGYIILASIIENVTKMHYWKVVQERIFTPAGMDNTVSDFRRHKISNIAIGYHKSSTGGFYNTRAIMDSPSPAGGYYTTAMDLLKLHKTITLSDVLLADEQKLLLYTNFENVDLTDWSEYLIDPETVIGWARSVPGYSSVLYNMVDKNITIIVLSNYGSFFAESFANRTVAILTGSRYSRVKKPANEFIYDQIANRGIKPVESEYYLLMKSNGYDPTDHLILNRVGYDLIRENRFDIARDIFELNSRLFSDQANVYDSLGEIYFLLDDSTMAEKNYRRSLELDPSNDNARRILQNVFSR